MSVKAKKKTVAFSVAYKVVVSFNPDKETDTNVHLFLCVVCLYISWKNCPWYKVSRTIYKASEDKFKKLPMLSF